MPKAKVIKKQLQAEPELTKKFVKQAKKIAAFANDPTIENAARAGFDSCLNPKFVKRLDELMSLVAGLDAMIKGEGEG